MAHCIFWPAWKGYYAVEFLSVFFVRRFYIEPNAELFCKAVCDADTATRIYIENVLCRALELKTEKLGHWNIAKCFVLRHTSKFRFPN